MGFWENLLNAGKTALKVEMAAGTAVIGTVELAAVDAPISALQPNGTPQTLTVDATVGGVAFAAFPAGTTHVFWSVEAAQCRVWPGGTAPTTTTGHVVDPGYSSVWSVASASAAKWIRTGTVSAVISASPMKA
ncbi:MAG: hypothetical protein ACYCX3_16085 [Thermoleophilia bacterium]